MVFENDKEVSSSRIDDPLEAWYGDGLPTTNDDDDTESPWNSSLRLQKVTQCHNYAINIDRLEIIVLLDKEFDF